MLFKRADHSSNHCTMEVRMPAAKVWNRLEEQFNKLGV